MQMMGSVCGAQGRSLQQGKHHSPALPFPFSSFLLSVSLFFHPLYFFFLFIVPEIEPRALNKPCKHPSEERHPYPSGLWKPHQPWILWLGMQASDIWPNNEVNQEHGYQCSTSTCCPCGSRFTLLPSSSGGGFPKAPS